MRMDPELRQVLTVLIGVVGTSVSTILGMVFANRWAATRTGMEIREREQQRKLEAEERKLEWVREKVLAPLAEERRRAHTELLSILLAPRHRPSVKTDGGATVTSETPLPATAEDVQRAQACLAHISPRSLSK